MYTFLRAQLDFDVFLPARVKSFFSISVLHNGLLQTKRYVPPSEGKSCITYIGVPGEHVTPLARRYFGLGGSRRFMYVLRLS